MFEKVNPNHPDKIADRIAGAFKKGLDKLYKEINQKSQQA